MVGGTAEFLHEDSVQEIVEKIVHIRECYVSMKEAVETHARKFLYSRIAKKSLE